MRGAGTFARILRGVRQLLDHGFLPLLTVARTDGSQTRVNLPGLIGAGFATDGASRSATVVTAFE